MTLTEFLQRLLILPTRLLFRLCLGYRVIGQENYKNLKKPFIIIANHISAGDPFLITPAFPVFSKILPFHFVAKRELFEKKGVKRSAVIALGGFKVERGVGLEKTLQYPLGILKNGEVVVIFPTGAREKRGRPRKARRGAAYLALKTGVPILPIAIRNAKGITFKKFIKMKARGTRTTIIIGKPFYLPKEFKYPRDLDRTRDIIEKVLARARKIKVKKINNLIDLWKEWIDNEKWFDDNNQNQTDTKVA